MYDDVEVFVPTCGKRPSLPTCLEALDELVPPVPVTVIRELAPMSTAFNAMHEQATKEFFVQVDDDMILSSDAITKLRALLVEAPLAGMAALWLWDVHVGKPIVGVKIYRTAAVRESGGWSDVQSCEVDFKDRMRGLGWSSIIPCTPELLTLQADYSHPMIVGDHDPEFTCESAYERYRDLTMKQRRFGAAPWVEALPALFLERVKNGGDKVELAALAGCIAGALADIQDTGKEKNFNECPWHDGYVSVAKLLCLE